MKRLRRKGKKTISFFSIQQSLFLPLLSCRAYAEQTLTLNRMRGMLEDEMSAKRAAKLKEIQAENKRLALEKKQREAKWRDEQEKLNQLEIHDPNLQ